MFAKLGGTDKKKTFMKIIKKSKHELLWKALKQKKAIKKKNDKMKNKQQ